MNLGAGHSALNRFGEKGCVTTRIGGVTPERGGRRKRIYSLIPAGSQALWGIRQLRNRMWDLIPTVTQP